MQIIACSFFLLATGIAGAQAPTKPAAPAKTYVVPKTAWGDPDLQGVWPGTDLNGVPLQRPANFGERATLTDEEFRAKQEFSQKQDEIDNAVTPLKNPLIAAGNTFLTCEQDKERCRDGVRIGPPNYWDERGKPSRLASLIVDPPNGRLPALTAEAQRSAQERAAAAKARACTATSGGCHDSWTDESLWDRCISRGALNTMLGGGYNRGMQIQQSPGFVTIRNEMIHETRVVPVGAKPHVGEGVRSWMGDSRGHWEGGTLVVETTNYVAGADNVGGARTSEQLKVVERFTRTAADTLMYSLTVSDPKVWTSSWTTTFPLRNDPEYVVYEYACHEGNYYMFNALKGARAAEKK